MKISIIIPSQNDTEYLRDLLVFLYKHTLPTHLQEVIIVNNFEDENLTKLAEKSHAKLYFFEGSSHRLKAEAGAFVATGEILYFIKPGFFPPKNFDRRIIKAVNLKKELGSLYHPFIAYCCKWMNLKQMDRLIFFLSPMSNFFIKKKLFHECGGLKYDGKVISFRQLLNRNLLKNRPGLVH